MLLVYPSSLFGGGFFIIAVLNNYNRKEERESKRSWQPIYKDKEEKKLPKQFFLVGYCAFGQ